MPSYETRALQFHSCSVPAEVEGRVWFAQEGGNRDGLAIEADVRQCLAGHR